MKRISFILCILLVLYSCSETEDVLPEVKEPPVTYYRGFIGEKFLSRIECENANYTLRNDNPDIVSWEYTKNKSVIRIQAIKEGSGTISVVEADSSVVAIIHIRGYYFDGKNIEEVDMHPTLDFEVVVEAEDLVVKQLLENQLREDMLRMRRTLYTFDSETKEFTMDIVSSGQKYRGIYEWNIDSLALKYNNTVERYGFKVATGRDSYVLHTDKTKEYQQLYPDAGIGLVRLQRLWHDWDIKTHI